MARAVVDTAVLLARKVDTDAHHELARELVDSPAPVFDDARRIFRRDDGLAFGDAMLVGFMRHHDREYIYSFDDEFDAVDDITRLNAPKNPYS
jgi:hypothetical protein